jgi:predicted nucleotidyltransferase
MDPRAVGALRILSRVFSQEGRRFVLIGATVPQILLDFGASSGSRETRDVDAVAEVGSWEDFEVIRERLLQQGFREGRVAHELWLDEVRIDLIPFARALVQNDKLSWPYGDSVMTACGFEEALECARDQKVAPDLMLPVVSIPGLILTKVVAYMDRPEERIRDLIDILYCFERYEQSAETSRRFDHAGTEVEGNPLTYEEAGAYLLGTEVARLAKPNSLLVVRQFLDKLPDEYARPITQIVTEERRLLDSEKRRSVYRLFRVFGAGLNRTARV